MADNTTLNAGTGGDVIASDDLTTLNGGAVSGQKVQRVKIGFGVDGTLRDAEAANPLPVVQTGALPAGTNLLGKVGIDQTTPGTTNAVQITGSLPAGTNAIGILGNGGNTIGHLNELRANTLVISATGVVNTAVTATLPAAGASVFHYITLIQIVKLYSVVGVAAGAGVIITTTNLAGSLSFTTEQLASAAGTAATVVNFAPATPLKSSVANTATTIVAPLQLQTIWRINVFYFTAT